ncbi:MULTISPECIES: glycoside hydrolase [unclassified Pedobacter]|uniref:glycoside hydrolase n=1 Tax=unclassified Pedobacter TaxID=2628915 RepID=UPI001422F0E7|nr:MULTISPECIES: glycoside hydrolase [unclassified Pedobacter]NII82218.1 O-glycosyl hydrolase [Pedobacter sp. SG908]NMN36243.1 O-glycosyl hydrolase [Pedobacter sp. SG918]
MIKPYQHLDRFFICLAMFFYGQTALAQEAVVKIEIDPAITFQTIEGFGASDAWTCQFAGLWPAEKKEKMADLLFSTQTTKTGQPLGIGLNMWRFSIGGGSAAQGKASDIGDEWRRQYAFLQPDGRYDWSAMPGQTWFLKAAKTRGVKQFIGFVNSPHVLFTKNGKAYSTDGNCNLNFDKLPQFTEYLVTTIKGIEKTTGIELNYLSPANEPQWKWNEHNQEGCPYNNTELAQLYRGVNEAFVKNQVKTKIQVGEAGQLDYLYDNGNATKGNQVYQFFNASSPNYVGNLSNIDQSISGHSYFTTSPEQKFINTRKKTAEAVAQIQGLRYWMSEYCVLGDDVLKGEKRDLGMVTALFIAKLIHHDLVLSNATSWQWWLAVSAGDYKDGLVYIDKNKTDGQVYDSKLLWALGNYSRFIGAGSKRLQVKTIEEKVPQVYVSSYLQNKKLVTVAVNPTENDLDLDIDVKGNKQSFVQTYVTSAEYSLSPYKQYQDTKRVRVPAKSITTILSN